MTDYATMDGPKVDALAAEKVMGWKWMRWHDLTYRSPDGPLGRTLCRPEDKWLEPPDWVEWDPADPEQEFLKPRGPHDFSPSTDPVAAWGLFCHVRDTWNFTNRLKFFHALDSLIQSRGEGHCLQWPGALIFLRVGDYARAALMALQEGDEA